VYDLLETLLTPVVEWLAEALAMKAPRLLVCLLFALAATLFIVWLAPGVPAKAIGSCAVLVLGTLVGHLWERRRGHDG
jgi:MFS-type transporter involved in bile tolerance (Atg22 family)